LQLLFQIQAMVVVIDDRLPVHEHVGADDARDGFGLVLQKRLVDVRQIENNDIEIGISPTADLEFVRPRQLRKHARRTCARRLGFGMRCLEPEKRHARKIHTAVRGARVEDEVALDVVDFGPDQQMLRARDAKLDFAVFFGFEDFVQVFHYSQIVNIKNTELFAQMLLISGVKPNFAC